MQLEAELALSLNSIRLAPLSSLARLEQVGRDGQDQEKSVQQGTTWASAPSPARGKTAQHRLHFPLSPCTDTLCTRAYRDEQPH